MNLEDRGASRKDLEGNQEAMVPGGKCFRRESVIGCVRRCWWGKIKTGKLATEFSNVEGFGELGKRNLGAEVEVKEWLKYVQERMEGENLETEDIDISSKEVHYKGKERNE